MASKSINISALLVGFGLFVMATIPFIVLLLNNQKIEVSVKSADQSVKELTVQNQDLIRGRVAERDSVIQYKKSTDFEIIKRDSTITILQEKLTKEVNVNKELKEEVDSIKSILKKLKFSDLQPVGTEKNN